MPIPEFSRGGDSDFDSDQRGHLVYWDVIRKIYPLLEPAAPIPDPNFVIGKVGQQNLLPTHFTLKPKDLEGTKLINGEGLSLGKPVPPGISAFLFFGSRQAKQHNLDSISRSHLGRKAHYKNRMYIAQVRDINAVGWTAFYAPLINRNTPVYNPLHVIIVPNSIIASGITADATEAEKVTLANAFIS